MNNPEEYFFCRTVLFVPLHYEGHTERSDERGYFPSVITSYSIHYTKLYDCDFGDQPVHDAHRKEPETSENSQVGMPYRPLGKVQVSIRAPNSLQGSLKRGEVV